MIATRFLPPLAVIAAFTLAAVLLRLPPPPPSQHTICLELPISPPVLDAAREDIEGCAVEYDARVPGDFDMLVRVRLEPAGPVWADTFSGPDSPMLQLCVEEALRRIDVETVERTWVDLFVEWRAGRLTTTSLVTKRVPLEDELAYRDRPLDPPPRDDPDHIKVLRAKLEVLKAEQQRLRQEIAERRRPMCAEPRR
jgi:hypothetical protein